MPQHPSSMPSAPVSLERDIDEFTNILADVRRRMAGGAKTREELDAIDLRLAQLKRLKIRIGSRLDRRMRRLAEFLG